MYGIYDGSSVIAKFVTPLQVRSNQPIFSDDALSLKRYTTKRAGQRWEIESNLFPLSDSAHNLFVYMLEKGYTEEVQAIMPQNYGVVKSRSGTSNLLVTGSLNSNQVTVSNVGSEDIIPKGTFFRCANHDKVYIFMEEVNNSNFTNITIYPTLRAAVSATEITHKDDVIIDCTFDLDVVNGMVFTDGITMDIGTVRLIERID